MKIPFDVYMSVILLSALVLSTSQEAVGGEKMGKSIVVVAQPNNNLLSLIEAILNDPEFLALSNRQQMQILLRIYVMLENYLKSRNQDENEKEKEREWNEVANIISHDV
jgi:hypothetical protein